MELKLLVVDSDDKKWVHKRYIRILGGRVQLLSAFSVKEAEEHFMENSDLSLIIIDVLSGDVDATLSLVQKFRGKFAGPIIATSSSDDLQRRLMQAGCSNESNKLDLHLEVLKLLKL